MTCSICLKVLACRSGFCWRAVVLCRSRAPLLPYQAFYSSSTRLLPFNLSLHRNTGVFGVFGSFFSMAESAGPSEPRPSSGGLIRPRDDPTSSGYADNGIQCSSCGRWESPDQFQSKAKGRRSHTRTCLRCREKKVRISLR